MANNLLFGQGGGTIGAFQYSPQNPDDDGTAVLLRAFTAVFAPSGWWQEALHRILTLMVSANVSTTVRVTPYLEGLALDGTEGRPDARATFDLAPALGGDRITQKFNVGLFQPVRFLGSVVGRTGLRGTWVQFLIETTTPITVAVMESPADLRFDGVELEWEPLLGRQQVVNA